MDTSRGSGRCWLRATELGDFVNPLHWTCPRHWNTINFMKHSAEETEQYFEERARRADPAKVKQILARMGRGNPPVEGDELPPEFLAKKKKKK
jgi:hypothetical protein